LQVPRVEVGERLGQTHAGKTHVFGRPPGAGTATELAVMARLHDARGTRNLFEPERHG